MLKYNAYRDIITNDYTREIIILGGFMILENHEIAIPFDIDNIKENTFKRLARKVKSLVTNFIVRCLEIIVSLFGILLLIPLSAVVFFQNLKNVFTIYIYFDIIKITKYLLR